MGSAGKSGVVGWTARRDWKRWAKRLLKDTVQKLIGEARKKSAEQPDEAEVEKALGYFVRNIKRMQYGTFRAKGYSIGSGVVEAGCKNYHRWSLQTIGHVLGGSGR